MKKFSLLLCVLLSMSMQYSWGAKYVISATTGTFNGSGNYGSGWTATSMGFTMTAPVNNFDRRATGDLLIHSGSANSSTYTITAPTGCLINGYTIVGHANSTDQYVAAEGDTHTFTTTESTMTVTLSTPANTAQFTLTTANTGLYATIKVDYDLPVHLPHVGITVGAGATSLTAATSATDNDHWYLVTQTRNGESPLYDAGEGETMLRAAASVTPASLSGEGAYSSLQYLVRFVPTGLLGVYNLQFANGRYVTSTLTSGTTPGDYFFYNINSTDGHFGWNLTTDGSTYGSCVDNNGAGGTVVFYGGGEITTTGGNNDWTLYPVTLETTVTDGRVYSLWNEFTDAGYPVYTDDTTPKISLSTSTSPQLFVAGEDGVNGDVQLTPKFLMRRAEGDGTQLYYTGPAAVSYSENTDRWWVFLNTASSTFPNYSGQWSVGNGEDSPYTSLFGYNGSAHTTFIGKQNDEGFDGFGSSYRSEYLCARTTGTATWNSRWAVQPEPYTVYTLVVQNGEGNAVNNAYVAYSNPADAAITRSAQTNGGFFVIKNDVTPTLLMFSLSNSPTYKITNFSLSGTTITITVASSATTSVGEGRYHLWNCGQNRFLVQASDALDRSTVTGRYADKWDVVSTAVSGQYYIRNVDDGRYLHWAETDGDNFTLVADPRDASPVSFSSAATDVSDRGYANGCFAIMNPLLSGGRNHFQMSTGGYMSWSYENWEGYFSNNDWLIYPIEDLPTAGDEYLIVNKQSGKYATRGADDDSQLVQNAKGAVDRDNSVWTFTASGLGYKIANNGSTGNFLAKVTDTGTFTSDGITWYIKADRVEGSYYNISNNTSIDGEGHNMPYCWNNSGGLGNVIGLWNASGNAGSCWRFIPVDIYYENAVAYLASLYDEDHKDDLFYITESAYTALIGASHSTTAEKIAAANDMYNVLNDIGNFNLPEENTDYLIKNVGLLNYYSRQTYAYTNDASGMILKYAPYNSSYFWHFEKGTNAGEYYIRQSCYGTENGEFPEAAKRYIRDTQGDNSTQWVYTSTKPTNPLTLEMYKSDNTTFLGNTSILAGGNRMNGNSSDAIITWNDKDDNCKWEIIPVEDASVSLIAAAEAAITSGNNGAFTLTTTAITAITTAKNNLEDTPNYVNYYILEQLLLASSSYYQLETGRYLVRNFEYDTNHDGNPDDTETYLTSMINPVGVVEDAIGYWSIWDITNYNDGEYYTMQCEGNKSILTPTVTLEDAGGVYTDDGYLFYNSGTDRYQIGNDPGDNNHKLLFYPAVSVHPELPATASVSGSYAAITVASQVANDKFMNMWTKNDHIAYYNTTIADHEGKGCFWQFIPVKSENEVNHEGTHSGESEMFLRQVNGLVGYVGGVVTLDNVSSVAPLNDIALLRDAAISALDAGSALSYTSTYDGVTTSFAAADGGAEAYRSIIWKIHRIKNGLIPSPWPTSVYPNTYTAAEVKKFYQDLRPTETIDGADVKHPFFLENMSGQRPEYGARLEEAEYDGNPVWHCNNKANVLGKEGIFYVTIAEGTAGTFGTSGAKYTLKDGNDNWLAHGSMVSGTNVPRSADGSDALKFNIIPVIPGVWQMKDTGTGEGSCPWLTITGRTGDCRMHYYVGSEISSLWKFQTFNELDDIILKVDPDHPDDGDYFCTFSYPLNIKVPVDQHAQPYVCTKAYRPESTEISTPTLKLVFEAVPADGDYYYLEGNKGYLFKVPTGYTNQKDGKMTIQNSEYMSGAMPSAYVYDDEHNLLRANLRQDSITTENWRRYYALTYYSSSTTIGSYYGTEIKGCGMGFYHLRLGAKLNKQTAYVLSSSFEASDAETIRSVKETDMPAEMVFEDEDGNIVDVVEVLPDGTWQSQLTDDSPIYDLTGRRVTNPTRGVYIQNGKKVMYK